jgi:hypothetical protein
VSDKPTVKVEVDTWMLALVLMFIFAWGPGSRPTLLEALIDYLTAHTAAEVKP